MAAAYGIRGGGLQGNGTQQRQQHYPDVTAQVLHTPLILVLESVTLILLSSLTSDLDSLMPLLA